MTAVPATAPTFDGKYQIVRTIGEGGMGAVHEAINVGTGRRVAIKTMSPLISKDAGAVERFMREARAATMIDHPNVVQVFDIGVADGTPFMVMELLQGETLAALIEREGPLSPGRLVSLLGPALGALAAAHQRGIVHRDLKPENIFLARSPGTGIDIPKLLDFGISKVMNPGSSDMSLTHTGTVLGTPYYMAPEQAAGKRTIDARTDIYAVGVILYYAMTKQLPFNGENYNQLIVAILSDTPPAVHELSPAVSPVMSQVVQRAMAREMGHRFASVEELTAAVVYAAGLPGGVSMASTASDQRFAAHASATAPHAAQSFGSGGTGPSIAVPSQSGVHAHATISSPQPAFATTTGPQSLPTNRTPLIVAALLAVFLVLGGVAAGGAYLYFNLAAIQALISPPAPAPLPPPAATPPAVPPPPIAPTVATTPTVEPPAEPAEVTAPAEVAPPAETPRTESTVSRERSERTAGTTTPATGGEELRTGEGLRPVGAAGADRGERPAETPASGERTGRRRRSGGLDLSEF